MGSEWILELVPTTFGLPALDVLVMLGSIINLC
jgi:hypothetical protein